MRYIRDVRRVGCAAVLALCMLLTACRASPPGAVRVLVDGKPLGDSPAAEGAGVRVYITVDGAPVATLPFGEAHVVTIRLPDGGENVVRLTGESVYMERADCENQDCVHMGEVTLDNLELRVMGGFIVCLPHRVSVEVREQ